MKDPQFVVVFYCCVTFFFCFFALFSSIIEVFRPCSKYWDSNLMLITLVFILQEGMGCAGLRGGCWEFGCSEAPHWGFIFNPRCTASLVIWLEKKKRKKKVTQYEELKYTSWAQRGKQLLLEESLEYWMHCIFLLFFIREIDVYLR